VAVPVEPGPVRLMVEMLAQELGLRQLICPAASTAGAIPTMSRAIPPISTPIRSRLGFIFSGFWRSEYICQSKAKFMVMNSGFIPPGA